MAAIRDPRIDRMYERDRMGAYAMVALLWIVTLFVLWMSWPYMQETGVRIVALIAAALVLVFNTASIAAMINHYAEDKDFIYGLDIAQLDAANKSK
jgi:hypothetical protein